MKKDLSHPLLIVNCLAQFELFFQEERQANLQLLSKPATAKAQSLLVFLALRREQPHSRERLVGMFWRDRPDRRARRSLATALWQIRRCFPDKSVIQADVHTVQFSFAGHLQLDTEAFVTAVSQPTIPSLQTAVSLYRGDFLDGFYDEWIITERYRLQSQFLDALTRLMRLQETAGDYKPALETAVRLLDNDPLREEAYRVVMRAYALMGQRNAALKQYTRCRQIIAKELGTEPMPQTQQLYDDIRHNKLATPASVSVTPLLFSPTQPGARPASGYNPLEATAVPPLVGRDRELIQLAGHWQQALAGASGLLIIRGEAGVGKTRLAESFAEQLQRQGYRVLWGRCYEFERVLPYQPLVEAVRSLLPHLSAQELNAIPDWSLAELARLLPELLERRPELSTPIPAEPEAEGEQTALFTALARFLVGLAALVPCLIVVEDLQWSGESTLHLLHFLARQLQDQPILILGTTRPMVATGHLRPFQDSLAQENLAALLNLPRLTADDVTTLIAKMSGRENDIAPLAQRLFQETEGNPFFLMELSKSLFENNLLNIKTGIWQGDFKRVSLKALPLPDSIALAVRARVRRLPKEAQKLLGVTAVLGREFDFEPLNAIWGRGEEATLEGLDQLLRARLIREGSGDLGRDYAFAHHKIQEVIYAGIPRRRRQHLHAQAGQALQAQYAAQETLIAAELAHHFEQGQRLNPHLLQPAVHFLHQAGQQAVRQFANAEAQNYFSRALALTPEADFAQRYQLLTARQEVCGLQGDREQQTQDIASLQAMAPHLTPVEQAAILVHEARLALETGDYLTAMASAKTAVTLAQTNAEGFLLWGQAIMRQGDYLEAQPVLHQALELAKTRQKQKLTAASLNNIGLSHYCLGDYGAAQACYQEALPIFQAARDRRGQSAVLNNLGVVSNEQGDNVAAAAYYRQALALHRQTGNRRGECLVLGNLGVIAAAQGAFTEARAYHTQSRRIARKIGHRLFEGNAWLNLGNVSLYLGLSQEAGKCYQTALDLYRQIGNRAGEGWAYTYMSLLAHRQGEQEPALTYGLKAQHITQEIGDLLILGYACTHIGHAYTAQNRLSEAAAAYQEAVMLRRELGEPNLLMESLSGLARVYLAQQNLEQALVWVEEILAYLEAHTLEGADEPLRIYLTCYHVLTACQNARAPAVLQAAHTLLQTQAAQIEDEELRRRFLTNVPFNEEVAGIFSSR